MCTTGWGQSDSKDATVSLSFGALDLRWHRPEIGQTLTNASCFASSPLRALACCRRAGGTGVAADPEGVLVDPRGLRRRHAGEVRGGCEAWYVTRHKLVALWSASTV